MISGRITYLKGLGRAGQRFVLLLDLDRVLSAGEVEEVAKVASGDEHGARESRAFSGIDDCGPSTRGIAEGPQLLRY